MCLAQLKGDKEQAKISFCHTGLNSAKFIFLREKNVVFFLYLTRTLKENPIPRFGL